MKDRFEALVQHLLDGGFFLEQAVEVLEKSMIQNVLDRNKGNQCAAAKQLGIHRNTLQRKMVQFAINGTKRRAPRKPVRRATPTVRKRNSNAA